MYLAKALVFFGINDHADQFTVVGDSDSLPFAHLLQIVGKEIVSFGN